MEQKDKKLILLELNEINFDIVKKYIQVGNILDGFKTIIETGIVNTVAENKYEQLEPWIQWPSVHTGLTFEQHNIFRLGDIVNSSHNQIFEKIETLGYSVGAISPMNASNKLKNPAYFIPDPWTKTNSDNSPLSRMLSEAISQAVNDNSNSRITFLSKLKLIISFMLLVRPKKWIKMLSYALSSSGKSWRKAIFLDKFLFEVHQKLIIKKKPNFSTIFLNAGAHIQHHYFFNCPHIGNEELKNPEWYINSDSDPLFEVLKEYDEMIQELINNNYELIISTGLSQKPYEYSKFYYRLSNHDKFLKKLDINFEEVHPRMTRDFLIKFKMHNDALQAAKILSELKDDKGLNFFNEIDVRDKELFVVLTYPNEITIDTNISIKGISEKFIDYVSFVAIKNGEHQGTGFNYFSKDIKNFAPVNQSHVSGIHYSILNYFN